MADQGFHSVVQLVSAMPHIVRVEGPFSDGDWLLFDASQPKTEIYSTTIFHGTQSSVLL